MPFLKQQIDIINDKLAAAAFVDRRFAGSQINGIAQLAAYKDGETIKTAPVMLDANNEPRWVGLDDTYPLIIYHRIQALTYAQINNPLQFGRGVNRVSQSADVMLVVYGRTEILKITSEQLEALIVSGLPDLVNPSELETYKLDSMLVTLVSSNLNAPQIYAGEYGTTSPLGAEEILLAVRYRIDTTFRKNCFTICDCEGVIPPPAE